MMRTYWRQRSLGGMIAMNHSGAPSTYNRKIDLQVAAHILSDG
jgi:hypothetical protein